MSLMIFNSKSNWIILLIYNFALLFHSVPGKWDEMYLDYLIVGIYLLEIMSGAIMDLGLNPFGDYVDVKIDVS